MKRFGQFLLKNPMSAGLVALIIELLIFMGLPTAWLSIIIMALVTLRNGARDGLVVLAWIVLPPLALLVMGNDSLFYGLVLLRIIPIFILALILRKTASWSFLLQVCALTALAIVLIGHVFIDDLYAHWYAMFGNFFENLNNSMTLEMEAEQRLVLAGGMAKIATGVYAVVTIVTDLLILSLARGWQAAMFNPGGLRKELYELSLPMWFAGLSVLVVLAWQFNVAVGVDASPIIIAVYALVGLSLCHSLSRKKEGRLIFLIAVYILLMFFSFYAAIMIAILGFIDSWYPLRRKLINTDSI